MISESRRLERDRLCYEEEKEFPTQTPDTPPLIINDEKAIFVEIAWLSSPQNVQPNWWRILHHAIIGLSPESRNQRERLPVFCERERSEKRNKTVPGLFLENCRRLDEKGHSDSALDLLYDSVDRLMRDGEFSTLNALLDAVRVESFSLDMLLGLLTATLPARTRLPARKSLFQKIESVLMWRGDYEDGLLTGLE